jgi:hypothetical protein
MKYLMLKGGEMTILQLFNILLPGIPIALPIISEVMDILKNKQ